MNIFSMGEQIGEMQPNGLVKTKDQRLLHFIKRVLDEGLEVMETSAMLDGFKTTSRRIKPGEKGYPKALWYALWEQGFTLGPAESAQKDVDAMVNDIAKALEVVQGANDLLKTRQRPKPAAVEKVRGKVPRGARKHEKELLAEIRGSYRQMVDSLIGGFGVDVLESEAQAALDEAIDMWLESTTRKVVPTAWRIYKTGLSAGMKDAGVKGVAGKEHKLGLNFITKHPNGILDAVRDMGDETRQRMSQVVTDAFAGVEPFELENLKAKIRDVEDIGNFRAETIIRTEISKISNEGRIMAWGEDPLKNEYSYWWVAVRDDRMKTISGVLENNSPYTFENIKKLWREPTTEMATSMNLRGTEVLKKKENDSYRQRCSLTRTAKRW